MNRRRIAMAIALSFILIGPGHAADQPPLEKSFLGLSWGTDIREHEGFEFLHGKEGLRFYTKPGTVRTVKDIRVEQVVYGTYDYQFFAAFLLLDSPEAFAELRDYMESRYGFPKTSYQARSQMTTHRWRYRQIKMKLKTTDDGQGMKLAFYYTPISQKVNETFVEREQNGVRWLPIERDKKPEALPLLEF